MGDGWLLLFPHWRRGVGARDGHLSLPVLHLDLGDLDDQHAIGHFGGDASNVDLGRVSSGAQVDLLFEDADFAFSAVEGEEFESGFVDAGAVDDTADSEGAVLSVPVNAEVFFLGTGKGEVDHVVGGCVEDVGPRLKVNTFCKRGFADCETVKAQPFNCAREIEAQA
jgi:hypothetical protein